MKDLIKNTLLCIAVVTTFLTTAAILPAATPLNVQANSNAVTSFKKNARVDKGFSISKKLLDGAQVAGTIVAFVGAVISVLALRATVRTARETALLTRNNFLAENAASYIQRLNDSGMVEVRTAVDAWLAKFF